MSPPPFTCDYILMPIMRWIPKIKVCEIVTKPRESNGPDNNGGDGNTCLRTATFLTLAALKQRLTETCFNRLYGVEGLGPTLL